MLTGDNTTGSRVLAATVTYIYLQLKELFKLPTYGGRYQSVDTQIPSHTSFYLSKDGSNLTIKAYTGKSEKAK